MELGWRAGPLGSDPPAVAITAGGLGWRDDYQPRPGPLPLVRSQRMFRVRLSSLQDR